MKTKTIKLTSGMRVNRLVTAINNGAGHFEPRKLGRPNEARFILKTDDGEWLARIAVVATEKNRLFIDANHHSESWYRAYPEVEPDEGEHRLDSCFITLNGVLCGAVAHLENTGGPAPRWIPQDRRLSQYPDTYLPSVDKLGSGKCNDASESQRSGWRTLAYAIARRVADDLPELFALGELSEARHRNTEVGHMVKVARTALVESGQKLIKARQRLRLAERNAEGLDPWKEGSR